MLLQAQQLTPTAAGETRPAAARRIHGTESDSQHTVAKSSRTGSVASRKQPTTDIKAHATKQVRKTGGENVASKPAESQSHAIKRIATDLTVSAAKSGTDSNVAVTDVKSSRKLEKPSSRSATGGQQDARKPQQRSASDLMASAPHVDSNQHHDEKVSTIVCAFVAISWHFYIMTREFAFSTDFTMTLDNFILTTTMIKNQSKYDYLHFMSIYLQKTTTSGN